MLTHEETHTCIHTNRSTYTGKYTHVVKGQYNCYKKLFVESNILYMYLHSTKPYICVLAYLETKRKYCITIFIYYFKYKYSTNIYTYNNKCTNTCETNTDAYIFIHACIDKQT